MDSSTFLILGANGQLGMALKEKYPSAQTADVAELDITNRDAIMSYDWSKVSTILNAAAYTNVDGAETEEGRRAAWKVNALAVALLSEVASKHKLTVVHLSTDYVFDGTESLHAETEAFSPLSVYGNTKAAGDIALGLAPKHYILRTSWVIGEGKNFVRTMLELGKKGVSPTVVADQIGRPTFTVELVRAIDHLLTSNAAAGTYNVTNEGDEISWAGLTRKIFKLASIDQQVTDTTTAAYYEGKEGIAPRPLHSTLSLEKIHSTGFSSNDWQADLENYIKKEMSE